MHVHLRRRRIPSAISVLWVAALLAICCSGTAIAAVSSKPKPKPKPHHVPLGGSWSGQYSGAFSGTFTLTWKLSKGILKGSITLTKPSGTYTVGGSVHGSTINFGAVGAGATYKGSVSGSSMSGTYQTPQGDGTWSAHKS